jgi:hypothetical protein
MHHRPKVTWLALAVLALSAEGVAVAQTAPTPASTTPGSAGPPPPAAARANPLPTAKKGGKDAVDWNGLASRQAAAGNTGGNGLAVPGGPGTPVQSSAVGAAKLQSLHGDASAPTPTTAGQVTRIAPEASADPGASTSPPAPAPDAVLAAQINPVAKSCYETDPSSASRPSGRLVILVKVTPTGDVDSVSVGINDGVSPSVARCITTAARAVKFTAPGAAGAAVPAAFKFPMR